MQNQELQWVESVHILRNFIYWVVRRNEMLQSFYYKIFKDIQGMLFKKCIWTAFHYPGTTFSHISQTHMNKETVNFLDASVVFYIKIGKLIETNAIQVPTLTITRF